MTGLLIALLAGAVLLALAVGYALSRRRHRQREISRLAGEHVRRDVPDEEFWKRWKRERKPRQAGRHRSAGAA